VVHDEKIAVTRSLADDDIRSLMCVPLMSHDRTAVGAIQLDAQCARGPFDSDDVQLLMSVASQASISVEYAHLHNQMLQRASLQKEMEFAHRLQQNFLPQVPAQSRGYRFWAYYLAAGEVGGDLYDFVELPNGNLAVLLADVAGKGVPAALLMAKLSAVSKTALLSHWDNVPAAMREMNREVCRASIDAAFVTLAFCVVDPTTHELTVASAGHLSPLVRRRDGAVDPSAGDAVRGYPLGVDEDHQYQAVTTRLEPGESVLVFSDGISEATDSQGNLYTSERVSHRLAEMNGRTPSEMGQALLDDVRRHMADTRQDDDISLVVFQREEAV
jgi:serine phosphatase RsbU (regulator of sigma subunit)